MRCVTWRHAATHCNTLQHTATHCNTLQHTATHCNTLQHTATHCNKAQVCAMRDTAESVMWHSVLSHVTQKNWTCHVEEWVMCRKEVDYVCRKDDVCPTCDTEEWVTWHRVMSQVTQKDSSCHTEEWNMCQKDSITLHRTATHCNIELNVTQRNEICVRKRFNLFVSTIICVLRVWTISIFWRINRCFRRYGVAMICRLLKIIGLFCKRALQKRLHSAKETYNLKEPTNRSHPIYMM